MGGAGPGRREGVGERLRDPLYGMWVCYVGVQDVGFTHVLRSGYVSVSV